MANEPDQMEDEFEDEIEEEDEQNGEATPARFTAPDDFERVTSDVEAYYDPAVTGAIIFRPNCITLMDNNQETEKSSALVMGELLEPATLVESVRGDDDDEEEADAASDGKKKKGKARQFPKGTAVGIWVKRGMKDLLDCKGSRTWMAPNGWRKIKGRPKPMQLFDIRRAKGSTPEMLPLLRDQRKNSIIEPAQADNPPWWLDVLDEEEMMAMAEAAAEAKAAAIAQKRTVRNVRRGKPATKEESAPS